MSHLLSPRSSPRTSCPKSSKRSRAPSPLPPPHQHRLQAMPPLPLLPSIQLQVVQPLVLEPRSHPRTAVRAPCRARTPPPHQPQWINGRTHYRWPRMKNPQVPVPLAPLQMQDRGSRRLNRIKAATIKRPIRTTEYQYQRSRMTKTKPSLREDIPTL